MSADPLFESLEFKSLLRNKDLPAHIRETLRFQWAAIAQTSKSVDTYSIAHSLARRFVRLLDEHFIEYPAIVRRRLCAHCSAVLIPGFSCTTRLRPRRRKRVATRAELAALGTDTKSSGVKNLGRDIRLRNEVVVGCALCGGTGRREAASLKVRPLDSKGANQSKGEGHVVDSSSRSSGGYSSGNSTSTSTIAALISPPPKAQGATRAGKFSFLTHSASLQQKQQQQQQLLPRRASAPGRLDLVALEVEAKRDRKRQRRVSLKGGPGTDREEESQGEVRGKEESPGNVEPKKQSFSVPHVQQVPQVPSSATMSASAAAGMVDLRGLLRGGR